MEDEKIVALYWDRSETAIRETQIKYGRLLHSLSLNEDPVEEMVLEELINSFLDGLPAEQRDIFLRRYWCFDSIRQIAARYGCSESRVTSLLFRARAQLREHLRKGGVSV